jgi:DNA-binding MarR family transcriptional regulator
MTLRATDEAEAAAVPGMEPGVQAEEIRLLILMVNKAAMRDLDRRLEASGTGISGLQYGVMRLLSHESATISELSSRMLLAPATLVPVIDTLERKRFVQRGADPKDRRRIPLILTPSGLEIIMRVPFTSELDSLSQGLAGLGREKARHLQALLFELVSHLTGTDELIDRAFALPPGDLPKSLS